MRIIQPSFEIIDHNNLLKVIELGGRVCYKSEDKMGLDSDLRLIEKLKSLKHESVFEHGVITIKFVFDRGVSHEFVRHRHASPSQESTRYCNYSKAKFDAQITVIDLATGFNYNLSDPKDAAKYEEWQQAMVDAERHYLRMLELGATPQEARSVLPNSLKTEIQVTANVREWRLILRLRTGHEAHPQIRQVMVPLAHRLAVMWPILFSDLADVTHDQPALDITDVKLFGSLL